WASTHHSATGHQRAQNRNEPAPEGQARFTSAFASTTLKSALALAWDHLAGLSIGAGLALSSPAVKPGALVDVERHDLGTRGVQLGRAVEHAERQVHQVGEAVEAVLKCVVG